MTGALQMFDRPAGQSHHLSADGAADGSQPRPIPPVGYNAGACPGEKQHVFEDDPHHMEK